MYSIIFYLPVALREEGPMFDGWTINAVLLSILGSAGGLLVALTMKYTDAVLKTFATSGAIIVTAVGGHFLMDSPLDIPIGVGAGCTVLSLLNYSDDGGGGGGGGGGGSAAATAKEDGGGGDRNNGVGRGSGKVAAGAPATNGTDEDDDATQSLMTRTGSPNTSVAV